MTDAAVAEGAPVTVVDAGDVAWVSGADVFATMAPAFRDNIGADRDAALALLARYHARCLWNDPSTGRRIDHVRCDPGYRDLSEAYHDSVEECLVLGGVVDLTAEGRFEAGDYFWRPPGWIHSAVSPDGFEALLMMEGAAPCEGSHHVSRVVRPDVEAGQHVAVSDPVGPRGYVRRAESRHQVWRPHDDHGTRLGATGPSQVLSRNVDVGTETTLVRVGAEWMSACLPSEHERFVVLVEGSLDVGGPDLAAGSLVRVAAHVPLPLLRSRTGALLMVKTSSVAEATSGEERA